MAKTNIYGIELKGKLFDLIKKDEIKNGPETNNEPSSLVFQLGEEWSGIYLFYNGKIENAERLIIGTDINDLKDKDYVHWAQTTYGDVIEDFIKGLDKDGEYKDIKCKMYKL
jgi:hypothetical protein